ncbi:MAG: hypothetical protein Q8P52_02635 [bacterium]|nr:hypothetical protein [bacterium]
MLSSTLKDTLSIPPVKKCQFIVTRTGRLLELVSLRRFYKQSATANYLQKLFNKGSWGIGKPWLLRFTPQQSRFQCVMRVAY